MWRSDSSHLHDLLTQSAIKPLEDEDAAWSKKLLFNSSGFSGSSFLEDTEAGDAEGRKHDRHNIATSKEVLERAVTLPGGGPGGALGSLLSLLLSSKGKAARRTECFETLNFLLSDKGNRKTFLELEASSVILHVMSEVLPSSQENIELLLLAMRTLVNIVGKQDACSDSEKCAIWHEYTAEDHPFLLLLSASHLLSRAQLAELLTLLKQLAFADRCSEDGSRSLIQPQLLMSIESLLHPQTDGDVLLKAMALVKAASTGALCDDLAVWTRILFRLVPLLVGRILNNSKSSLLIDTALTTLLNLAERSRRFREAIVGAGFIAPLLSLVNRNVRPASIRTSSSLILAAIAESSSLARTQLSRAVPIRCLLNAVSFQDGSIEDQGTNIALLICLSQLVSTNPTALHLLRQMGGIPKLERLAEEDDCDVAEEAENLLDLLSQGKQMIRGSTFDSSDANITITFRGVPSNFANNSCEHC